MCKIKRIYICIHVCHEIIAMRELVNMSGYVCCFTCLFLLFSLFVVFMFRELVSVYRVALLA